MKIPMSMKGKANMYYNLQIPHTLAGPQTKFALIHTYTLWLVKTS